MTPLPSNQVSPRTLIIGAVSFVALTTFMLVVIEWLGVEHIQEAITATGPLAPAIYVAIKALTYVFAPLSAGPIQLSSGVLFGLWPGTFYSMLGELIGGAISFWIARKLGRAAVMRFVGEEGMTRVDEFVAQLGGWRALAYARLFLFSVFDFITYAAGMTKAITFREYMLVSAIVGFIPTFLFVAIGASLAEDRGVLLLFYGGIGVLAAIPFIIHWWQGRRGRKL